MHHISAPLQQVGTLAEISVLEILGFDDDGNGQARPVDADADDIDICVRLSRRRPRTSDRTADFGTPHKIGPSHYEARIIRVLDRQPKHIFGIAVATGKTSRDKMHLVKTHLANNLPCNQQLAASGTT